MSGMGKATNFKFYTHIHRIDGNKGGRPLGLKISAKVAVGVSKIFWAPIIPLYRAHGAVIYAIAQLSSFISL